MFIHDCNTVQFVTADNFPLSSHRKLNLEQRPTQSHIVFPVSLSTGVASAKKNKLWETCVQISNLVQKNYLTNMITPELLVMSINNIPAVVNTFLHTCGWYTKAFFAREDSSGRSTCTRLSFRAKSSHCLMVSSSAFSLEDIADLMPFFLFCKEGYHMKYRAVILLFCHEKAFPSPY